MANMIPISTVTVGSGGVSNIQFSNIPLIYDDLLIKLSSRTNLNGLADGLILTINGSTAGIVTTKTIQGNGSAASAFGSPSGSDVYAGDTDGATATSNTFGSTEIYITNYKSSKNKSFSTDHVMENNATTAYAQLTAGLWSSTAPITTIKIGTGLAGVSSFVQHTTATLYGIRKS